MVSGARMSRRTKRPAAAGGGTTYTLFPTAESAGLYSASQTSYANARAGDSVNSNTLVVGQEYFPGDSYAVPNWTVLSGFLSFDTSGVTGTISSATLSLGLDGDASTTDFIAQARVRDWGATLEVIDYVPGADLGALTLVATLASAGIGALGAYKEMVENGTALRTAINQAGFTRLIFCSDRTVANTVPTNAEYMQFHGYNHSTLKPKLVVVTT